MADDRRSLARVPWQSLWEIPTGAVDAGETETGAAQRELAEEAGSGTR